MNTVTVAIDEQQLDNAHARLNPNGTTVVQLTDEVVIVTRAGTTDRMVADCLRRLARELEDSYGGLWDRVDRARDAVEDALLDAGPFGFGP